MSEKRECFCRLFLRDGLHVHDCPDAPKPTPAKLAQERVKEMVENVFREAIDEQEVKSRSVLKRFNVQAGRPMSEGVYDPPKDVASGCLPECYRSEVIGGIVHDGDHSPDCQKSNVASEPRKSGRTMTLQTQTPGGQDVASEPDFWAADEVAATMAPMVAKLTRENVALKAEVERMESDKNVSMSMLKTANLSTDIFKRACEKAEAERDEARAEVERLKAEADRKISDLEFLVKEIADRVAETDQELYETRAEAEEIRSVAKIRLDRAEAEAAKLREERDLRRELQGALEALRLACSLVPAMNHRDYNPLGARVNKALRHAEKLDNGREEKGGE